jgi:dTDP-4-amino-4,6-dideoxygalactose transaminase
MERDELLLALRAANIGASIHYRPLHQQAMYALGGPVSLPITEALAERIMTLPISARMNAADVDYVVEQFARLTVGA